MVTHHIVYFSEKRPNINLLLDRINDITEIKVEYNEEKFLLFSDINKDKVYLYKEEKNSYCITTFETDINYLVGVTIYALLTLGGKSEIASLPSWANKSWSVVAKNFNSLPRKIWYNMPNNSKT